MRTNRSVPPSTVIPQLACTDVRQAADWLAHAFGFAPRVLIGNHRVQMTVGDGSIVLMEHRADGTGAHASVLVRVEDIDAHCRRAERNGAVILAVPTDQAYSERQYTARDPDGHHWTFTETIADVAPEDWGGESAG
jgi:uncharacterized glyoxalase superfamily protein PhnB